MKDILIIEPFYGGSHERLIRLILSDTLIEARSEVCLLPAKKWPWRARTSALYFSQVIPVSQYRVLFTSSVLNLSELIALRPDLAHAKKIVYFHENQLVYPVRKQQDRDFQFGYNQILTSLVADLILFNSLFNMESFLSSISSHLKLIPDHRPKNIEVLILPKCQVLYFPIVLESQESNQSGPTSKINSLKGEIKSISSGLNLENIQNPENVNSNTDSRTEAADFVTTSFQSNINSGSFDAEKYRCCDKPNIVSSLDKTCDKTESRISGSQNKYDSSLSIDQEDEKISQEGVVKQVNMKGAGTTFSAEKTENKHGVIPEFNKESLVRAKTSLHIVWPHRWEHDKDPESFFKAVLQLQSEGQDFVLSVIGETFTHTPSIFYTAKAQLLDKIIAWGYQTREDYLSILASSHVVVSTALHEFFGVSMLEAVEKGCYPLCPRRLVYPEIYPEECLYSTQAQLVKKLRRFCKHPEMARQGKCLISLERFSWKHLQWDYKKLLLE